MSEKRSSASVYGETLLGALEKQQAPA